MKQHFIWGFLKISKQSILDLDDKIKSRIIWSGGLIWNLQVLLFQPHESYGWWKYLTNHHDHTLLVSGFMQIRKMEEVEKVLNKMMDWGIMLNVMPPTLRIYDDVLNIKFWFKRYFENLMFSLNLFSIMTQTVEF